MFLPFSEVASAYRMGDVKNKTDSTWLSNEKSDVTKISNHATCTSEKDTYIKAYTLVA